MKLQTLLFYVLLICFLYLFRIIISKKNFRRPLVTMLVIFLGGLLFLSQSGSKTFKVGALVVSTEEKDKQARFEIKNSTKEEVKQEVKFVTSDEIKDLKIYRGNNFISKVGGGIGNNYVVYYVNLPPHTIIEGTAASSGQLFLIPQSSIRNRNN